MAGVTQCSKCIYCYDPEPMSLDALDRPKIGVCRRHAPRNVIFAGGNTLTLWPNVKIYHDGCGEGEFGISTLVSGNGHK